MMSYKSIETKAIVDQGLQNIKNPFFYYMCEKNKFSIDKMGGINYMSIAFYVTPFINAIVRSGIMEEKDIVFKSMFLSDVYDSLLSSNAKHVGPAMRSIHREVRGIRATIVNHTTLHIE